jgi:hypothetical protein
MAARTSKPKPASKPKAPTPSVAAFLAALQHPMKPELLTIRELILGTDPSISEGIKWNAPSFQTSEYFATFQLRAKAGVQVILHLGAKVRDKAAAPVTIDDPQALLEWLAPDRASVKFRDAQHIEEARQAFTQVIRQWISFVQ